MGPKKIHKCLTNIWFQLIQLYLGKRYSKASKQLYIYKISGGAIQTLRGNTEQSHSVSACKLCASSWYTSITIVPNYDSVSLFTQNR